MEVCLYDVIFYRSERGDSPVDDFLDGLDNKSRAKVAACLSFLEEQGPNLKRPYANTVGGKIRELRIHHGSNQYRILYFFQVATSDSISTRFLQEDAGIEKEGHRIGRKTHGRLDASFL